MISAFALVVAMAGPSPDAIREAADTVFEDDAWQRELPTGPIEDEGGPTRRQRKRRRQVHLADPRHGSAIGGTLMWILIIFAGVLVVVVAARELGGWSGADPPAPADAEVAGAAPRLRVGSRPLEDAEALARASRFAEAVHVLLLRTLETLGRQIALEPALTSREILARAPLGPEGRGALRALVGAVEITVFGGQAAGREDYSRCVAAYRHLAETLERKGAPV